jgi:hypothetical protein
MRDEFMLVSRTDSSEDVETFVIRVTGGARRWPGFCTIGESGMLKRSKVSSDDGGRVRFRGGALEASSFTRGRTEPTTEVGEDASVGLLPLMKPLETERASGPNTRLVPLNERLGTGSLC